MLLDKMIGIIVGIFIAPPMSHLTHQTSYRVTQVEWHRLISAMLDVLLNPRVSLVQRVAFGRGCQVDHRFR